MDELVWRLKQTKTKIQSDVLKKNELVIEELLLKLTKTKNGLYSLKNTKITIGRTTTYISCEPAQKLELAILDINEKLRQKAILSIDHATYVKNGMDVQSLFDEETSLLKIGIYWYGD